VNFKSSNETGSGPDFSDIIFDFGANTGEDIEYYLNRTSRVIAVEADPSLALIIKNKFAEQILNGKLVLVNKVLTDNDVPKVDFYLHKTNPGLNQFQQPSIEMLEKFTVVELEAINVVSLVTKFASQSLPPLYCKIDLEGFDLHILRALFNNGMYPIYLSAECHTFEIASLIIATDKYEAFNLVEGESVPKFSYASNLSPGSSAMKQFRSFSAGPFGNDIPKGWLTKNAILAQLNLFGPGWKDFHAVRSRSLLNQEVKRQLPIKLFIIGLVLRGYRSILPKVLRTSLWKLRQRRR